MIHSMMLIPLFVCAGSDAPDGDGLKVWLPYYAAEAAACDMRLADGTALELQPQPLLNYTNTVRGGQQHGSVFVWTHQGRPAVVGSIWSSTPHSDPSVRSITNEFVSLSEEPVEAEHEARIGRRGPVPDWKPGRSGAEFLEVADAPKPAANAALRLVQMRRLAGSFDAAISVSELEGEQKLRLQPQPLYRYATPSPDVIDGALFSFVLATDPEIFLLLEARNSSEGPHWQYALARLTDRPLRVSRNGKEVWSRDQAEPYVGDQPYFLYWGVTTRPRSND